MKDNNNNLKRQRS